MKSSILKLSLRRPDAAKALIDKLMSRSFEYVQSKTFVRQSINTFRHYAESMDENPGVLPRPEHNSSQRVHIKKDFDTRISVEV